MKKFIHIHQLKEERQKLLCRKIALERLINDDWNALKKSISPNNLKEQILFNLFSNKRKQFGFVDNILSDLKITLLGLLKNKYESINKGFRKWISNSFFYKKK